jgi:hypothetical protein
MKNSLIKPLPDQRGHDGADQDVAVDDVRELVADHTLQLDPVHRLEQSLGHGDGGVLGVASGRERVQRALGDHVDLRLGDPRGDRQALDDVVQAGLLLSGDEPRTRRRQHDLVAGEVRDERHHDREGDRAHQTDGSGRVQQADHVPDGAEQDDRRHD